MLEEYFINQNEEWLGAMEIVEIEFPIPSIIKELEDLFLKLNIVPVIAGGVVSDSYLQASGLITENKSSDIDIFLDLKVNENRIRQELMANQEVSDLTEIQQEGIKANYSTEIIDKKASFRYKEHKCDLLFCINNRTKIWDFDLTFRQFMYLNGKLYATQLAVNDSQQEILRVVNPVNGLNTLQRIIEFQQRYGFSVEKRSLNLLLDYIAWRGTKKGLITKEFNNYVPQYFFTGNLRWYYFRWLSQKKAHGRGLFTYLLRTERYYNDYFTDLVGTYNIEYDSNLNYRRFVNKVKDIEFKIETEIEDKEAIINNSGDKVSSVAIDWQNCRRVKTILEALTQLEFEEFISGYLDDDKVRKIYKWHSPKLGKMIEGLEDFISQLDLEYYQNYTLKLCNQLLELFNTRGPSNLEFKLTISQQAEDLLSVSTDRNWTSCLELPEPDQQRISAARVAANLQPNTVVAYITDSNSDQWLGRVLIQLLQNGKLRLEKYYGEPMLKEILINELEEVIEQTGYQLNKLNVSRSCTFIEWEPYSDQGRVKKIDTDIYRKYYIDYSLPSFVRNKLNKIEVECEDNGKAGLFRPQRNLY
ncbi:hypothetical protein [Acetohalobium arabaticum]|uniref:Uncharacterized protein n=1 Tax=Acetohalobium arabaticum (strain ATCC 49924 / DSM 5501 / Z-7288) TaxID=574087 RepID=D9QVH9_ACEAZ|nr:hypothetical protein [Acetohalobium arabaticum]ADL12238.1 hypothetical protein Acear_0698 [Acetohalobium arabaticum DSM 5501]